MDDLLTRFVENLADRVRGPMHFRLLLQPLMALVLSFRDGRKDAREGKPPYGWAVFTGSGRRWELFRDGWKSVGKVFIVALVLDAVYQFIVLKWFYPGEALVVALVLAILPYLLSRGLINRAFAGKGRSRSLGEGKR